MLWNSECLREDVMFESCHLGKSFQNAGPEQSTKPAELLTATSTEFSIPGVRMEVVVCEKSPHLDYEVLEIIDRDGEERKRPSEVIVMMEKQVNRGWMWLYQN